MSNLLKDKYPELLKEWDFEKNKYLERKTLINKREAEEYIEKLLKEKNKKGKSRYFKF